MKKEYSLTNYQNFKEIIPSDTVDLCYEQFRGIYVGVGGDVSLIKLNSLDRGVLVISELLDGVSNKLLSDLFHEGDEVTHSGTAVITEVGDGYIEAGVGTLSEIKINGVLVYPCEGSMKPITVDPTEGNTLTPEVGPNIHWQVDGLLFPPVVFKNVHPGQVIPVSFAGVMETGTTATNLVGLF